MFSKAVWALLDQNRKDNGTSDEFLSSVNEAFEELELDADDENKETVGPEGSVEYPLDHSSYRLHGITTHTQRFLGGSFMPMAPDKMPYKGIHDQAREETLDPTDQAKLLIPFFSTGHSLNQFPQHWFPRPGTLICSFCKHDHLREGWRTIWQCARKKQIKMPRQFGRNSWKNSCGHHAPLPPRCRHRCDYCCRCYHRRRVVFTDSFMNGWIEA